MRTNRGVDRGSTGSGSGREREWLSEPKTPVLQDSKRVQADCLASLHLSSVYPTYQYLATTCLTVHPTTDIDDKDIIYRCEL
jgi:hypothetical protein